MSFSIEYRRLRSQSVRAKRVGRKNGEAAGRLSDAIANARRGEYAPGGDQILLNRLLDAEPSCAITAISAVCCEAVRES